jgi:hypothetical protein
MTPTRLLLGLLSTTAWACSAAAAPQIAIRDPFDAGFSVCATAAVRDCDFDFGTADVGRGRTFSFIVVNTGDTVLTVDSASLTGDAAFSADVVFTGPIEPGASALMRLRFAPTVAGAVTAQLSISSDATNLGADEGVVVALRGAVSRRVLPPSSPRASATSAASTSAPAPPARS